MYGYVKSDELYHYGVKGMKWRNRKNRPISREEYATSGNGRVGKTGNGLLVDYAIDDKAGLDGPRTQNPNIRRRRRRPLSRQEHVTAGNGKVVRSKKPLTREQRVRKGRRRVDRLLRAR